ncbi:hypothetical protein FOL47_005851, partial [Perkinsus chesapeaki]
MKGSTVESTPVISPNARRFVFAQFLSRCAHTFITTAVRYETLDLVGPRRYAHSQIWQNLTRTLSAQTAGVITDNAPPKKVYVLTDFFCAIMVLTIWTSSQNLLQFLAVANIALGVVMAFSGPVGKSLPPLVVRSRSELPMVNSFELTGDKIGRYLTPFAVGFFMMYFGFSMAVYSSVVFYLLVVIVKSSVQVDESSHSKRSDSSRPGLLTQLIEGVKSLGDPRLGVLVLNTLITNVFVYPFQTAAVPVILRQMDPVNWKSLTSLVSLGGVVGPILSNASAFLFSSDTFAGLVSGLTAQIVTGMLSVFCVLIYPLFPTGTAYAVLLSILWVLVIAANNQFTIFFNSLQQMVLPANQRGKFIANLLAVFTMGNAAGLWVFGQAISSPDHLQTNVCWVLALSVLLRMIIGGVVLYRKSALRRASSTSTDDEQLSVASASRGSPGCHCRSYDSSSVDSTADDASTGYADSPGATEIAQFLTAANLALGVVMAFSGPVGKSLPPSVVDTPSELPMVNSFELTGDKIGRYAAPFAVSFFLLYSDFSSLIHLSIFLFLSVALAKSTIHVKDTIPRSVRRKRSGFIRQLIEGVKSLNDPILGMLVFNTMLTNLFIYPFQTVALPVILKQMDPVNWKSLASLVSLGGVLGPVLSNFAAYRFRADIYKGLISGLIFQTISVLLCFCGIAATTAFTSSSAFALCLCIIWVVVVAANNHFTVFFNSIQQQMLPSGQRGRFIANMLALFTISNAAGLWLYGQAVSSGPHLHLFVDLILALCITLRV